MYDSTAKEVYAVIPVRNLNKSKSRLTNILPRETRKEFNKHMFLNVLKACLNTKKLKKIIVVSPDIEILKLSEEYGAEILNEEFERGVNGAISFAIEKMIGPKLPSILVLPSDLPLVTSEDLSIIISINGETPSIVISPSSRLDGTNALLLNPAKAIPTFFDQNSFSNHLSIAAEKQIKTTIYVSRRIMLDIDTPRDLKEFSNYIEANQYKFLWEHVGRLFPRT